MRFLLALRDRQRADGTRFYVGGLDQRRRPLWAGDLDVAIAEAAGLDAGDVGQIVDVWRHGSPWSRWTWKVERWTTGWPQSDSARCS